MQSAAATTSGEQARSLGSFEHACWADAAVERLAVEGHTPHCGWTIIPMISAVHKVQTCVAIWSSLTTVTEMLSMLSMP